MDPHPDMPQHEAPQGAPHAPQPIPLHTLLHLTQVLERTPAVLHALLAGLAPEWTTGNYGPHTWSAHQVVGHLIAAEREDWLPRVQRILESGEAKPFEPFAHTSVAGGKQPLSALLDEFAQLRAANLLALRALHLTRADLARTGTHPALGRVTLGQLLSTWAVHDLHHLRQIALAMAWQQREAVGPWRAYLNTLER
ncbi:MAG: DinB family protein [Phycisphaerales bacterium]